MAETKLRGPNEVIPCGCAFMPQVSLKQITKCHKAEKTSKGKYRLYAAMLRKSGKGIRKIARIRLDSQ